MSVRTPPEMTSNATGGCTRILLMVAALAGCLAADTHTDIVGQTVVGLAVWMVLFSLLTDIDRDERFALMACLVIATAGEMFLSLVWGLYTYRLGNIPLFVPPGHVLLLLLGLSLARRMPEAAALVIICSAGVYSLAAAAVGVDTFGVLLFLVLAVASLAMPNHRRLYASTFVLALALELYGTWLGNWTWEREVPGLPLVTTNPPGAAGALYCALDALVLAASVWIVPRLSAWVAALKQRQAKRWQRLAADGGMPLVLQRAAEFGQQSAKILRDRAHATLAGRLFGFRVVVRVRVDVVDDALTVGSHNELDAGDADPIVPQKALVA